ncbi:biotin-[acetyl-CoA-carboxylase] ligase [Ichthyobacterium seriolicida]|uniref:Biotin-[acetyl-CoA-carboxylase] ligase n=2 Tax=Ichthyobacterium seriolicida TaxID=242600 RepID=A0A1J1E5G6_9FLAO|nr:biotin-[acetyl-CoA-carboxylase] ligase [Ichthyobacterium seriolicida]
MVRDEYLQEWSVVRADYQSQGKGQMSNKWLSDPYKNLLCSILLKPNFLNIGSQFMLNMVVSLGIFKSLSQYVDNVKIKWPNDIYVNSKKIGGILIENTCVSKKITSSIVGIGINVNQEKFDNSLRATSIKKETNTNLDLEFFLEDILSHIRAYYNRLCKSDTLNIYQEYEDSLFQIGENKLYKTPDGDVFSGCIKGIDTSGRLKINTDAGSTLTFSNKEVIFIL